MQKEVASNRHHNMDELKNEWLHYIVDPIQLKPFTNKIQEIESDLSENDKTKDTEKEEDDFKEDKQSLSSQSLDGHNSTQKIAQTLLQDPSFDLPLQSLNDKILKTMIVEEGIECIKYNEKNKKRLEEKEHAIEFIFTREFKN